MTIRLYSGELSNIKDFPLPLKAVDDGEADSFFRERSDSFIVTATVARL
jgi:hypothetical protein